MHEGQEPSSTTNRVEGEADTVAQLGSNYGNVGFFRGNSFVLSLGPRWTVMIIVCLVAIATTVTVVLTRSSPSTSSPADPAEPLAVAVKTETTGCRLSWVSPKSPGELATVVDSSSVNVDWMTWEHSRDGAQASEATFTVTAQGREATSNVVITGVRVKILERRPPLKGTFLSTQCGAPVNSHNMAVDLDSERPASFPDDLDQEAAAELKAEGLRVDPIKFPYSVSSAQPEVFTVVARTGECDCTWVIEFEWSTDGRSGVQTVGNNGKPFRTTSRSNAVTCYLTQPIYCT